MNKTIAILLVSFFFISCHKDKFSNNNPYLPNYNFSYQINTDLPQYNNLKYAGNGLKVYPSNGPTGGVIVFNTGSTINAYDGSCPNQSITTCSTLAISGINATCSCDNAVYSLYTGQATGKEYPLKSYRTESSGTIITVYN